MSTLKSTCAASSKNDRLAPGPITIDSVFDLSTLLLHVGDLLTQIGLQSQILGLTVTKRCLEEMRRTNSEKL